MGINVREIEKNEEIENLNLKERGKLVEFVLHIKMKEKKAKIFSSKKSVIKNLKKG